MCVTTFVLWYLHTQRFVHDYEGKSKQVESVVRLCRDYFKVNATIPLVKLIIEHLDVVHTAMC
jgi:hypothetical protein